MNKPGNKRNGIRIVLLSVVLIVMTGCSAMKTSISKRNLEVETKMSDSIFLDPVSRRLRTLYLDMRNSTDKSDLDLYEPIKNRLAKKGFKIIDDPDAARYWLRANVLSVEKTDPSKASSILNSGYGGALTGAAIGASVGIMTGRGLRSFGLGSLVGAAVGGMSDVVSDALVEDVMYMVVTDVEIAVKVKKGIRVVQDDTQNARQGRGGYRSQHSSEVSNRKKYRTRIVSTANQVNLAFDEAIPELSQGLVRSLSGVF